MLLGLLALALVDSIKSSAIVVTLYLLSRESVPSQVVVYVAVGGALLAWSVVELIARSVPRPH